MGILSNIRRRIAGPTPKRTEQRIRMLNQKLAERLQEVKASYDAARTADGLKNIWANADAYDADSAHTRDVRLTLMRRSRYELANNGYSAGIARTYATDIVGIGPNLRMQSGSHGFNQMVERTWNAWAKKVELRRKLWCMAHARYGDGEGYGVIRRNPRIDHPVKLDVRLYEADQVHTPLLPFEKGYIDGIKFDDFGNPLWYDVLPAHPGSSNNAEFNIVPERVPSEFMLHWYRMERPGQHRAVPEAASTLNTGAAGRRFREAVMSAAEVAASLSALLKTTLPASDLSDYDPLPDFDTLELAHRLMVALPEGYDAIQMKGEHPNATYESFHQLIISEQARPVSMPRNKAAADSSDYNYASGRLDHQTYYGELDTVREDGNDLVLDKLFRLWFDTAVRRFRWLGGDPDNIDAVAALHAWDWPKHRVADIESEANANQTKLQSGQIGLRRLYSDQGLDLDDEITEMAATFGVDEAAVRKRLMDVLLPPPKQDARERPRPEPSDDVAALLRNRGNIVNGNGAHHVTP